MIEYHIILYLYFTFENNNLALKFITLHLFSHICLPGVALTEASYTHKEFNNHNIFMSCNFLWATKCAGSASSL